MTDMADFATLTIQHRLDNRGKHNRIFKEIQRFQQEPDRIHGLLQKEEIDPHTFGSFRFIQMQGGMFYEHTPLDEEWLKAEKQFCLKNYDPSWLLCFSYQEMQVIGIDMGVFQAETTVEYAMDRLRWIDIQNNRELDKKRWELYQWLQKNALPDDRIRLCSEWIYFHNEEQYDDFKQVQQDINKRIRGLKTFATCPHWTKNNVTTLAPEQQKFAV